ncbi:diphthamide biosynthesis protein 4 [Fusarium austroafricanum]|uniref:Diphthamide biosynthesis protein 4 n=1 Tax=Fusarium austroafricanum TaxID=2364996 RepID=A0A8H4JA68_9HYPO|nr:diphthamide biosynthesis protein 4 [Fusarium austroafricanum]
MASTSQFIGLAKSLPAPLQRFFARYPPAAILPENAPKTRYQEERPNPFRFYKHPVTGKWQDPVYSQRRQAELVKMARENGVEDLLPETRKGTEYKLAHRVEHGLRVKGTGVGQKVKGHIHERHMIAKMEARRKAMLEMPSLIKRWKRPRMASSSTATHYQVLNLTPTLLDTQHDSTPLIKRAYHRALLRNHPDKVANSDSSTVFFTVDQIITALNILSSPSSRTAYDAALRVSRPSEAANRDGSFQTGVETVDLDDLAFDESQECWYCPCRCGNEHSYEFREADLEEVSDEGELVVGCLDCSLWLRVHFAVMEEDEQRTQPSNSTSKEKS